MLQGDHLQRAEQTVLEIINERQRLARALARYEFVTKVWPSDANFLLIRVRDAQQVMEHCARANVLLRHFGGDLDDCIRISIGSPTENACLISVLDRLEGAD